MRSFAVAAAIGCTSLALVLACGDKGDDNGGNDLPGRSSSSSGDSGQKDPPDSSTSLDCTGRAKVDDRPACDTCAKQNCCRQITDCDDEPDCRALQDCIAPCDQEDIFCILLCQQTHPNGSDALLAVGNCAKSKCGTECPSPDAGNQDSGF